MLFGNSVSFLPYFVYTFDQMGRMGLGKGRGKFELTAVYAANDLAGQQKEQIYDSQSQMLNGNFKVWNLGDILTNNAAPNIERIAIQLVTPTRILHKNGLVRDIPYDLFIRTLLRRISLLDCIHCE